MALIWLYGSPYSGKTTFANTFPKPFFISLDKNAQFIVEDEDDYVNVNSVNEYSDALKKFMNDPKDYQTLVIDNIDLLEQFVREYYLDKLNIEDESDRDDYGKAWRLIREGTYQAVMKSSKFNGDIIWVSLQDEFITKSKLGADIVNYRPGINPKLHNRLSGLTTVVCRAYKDSKKVGKDVVNRYFISIGDTSNEISGTRLEIKETLIQNNYDEFINNFEKTLK